MKRLLTIAWVLAVVTWGGVSGCARKTSPAWPNVPPNTTLANIPVDGDTLFALATLHWDGEDDDGYIVGYEYRYVTYHVLKGDSAVQEWKFTDQTRETIAFESSDALNRQRFQVRAVDNVGDVDPTPAEKVFFTYQTVFPTTEILTPAQKQQFFAIDQTTDWWLGIHLIFRARDQDGEVVEYAWAVDDGDWHWMPDTAVYIGPEHFSPLEGKHRIRASCRDNTNLVDPVGDEVDVELIRPTFSKPILIIDETVESKFPFGLSYQDADVDSFYTRIFGTRDSWDYEKNGMPPKKVLGEYKLLVWHADNYFTYERDVHRLPQHINDIIDYLNVGGDFIMGGWRILKSFAHAEPFPKTFREGDFIYDYLHIMVADESPPIPDFNGAYSSDTLRFSSIRVDSLKLSESYLTSIPVIGLQYVNVMPRRAGFTSVIWRYKNDDYVGIPTYRGYPVGIRYYGTSFDAIVLGFPMFFINQEDAARMAQEMLRSLGY